MLRTSLKCLWSGVAVFGVVMGVAPPALGQYRPLPIYGGNQSASNNAYHIEFGFNLWSPAPDFVIQSESLGIQGTNIDIQADLGLQKKAMYDLRLVLSPAKKHKFRFQYLPMQYTGATRLTGDLIFNGIRFPVDLNVSTDFKWSTLRLGYEYDFVSRDSGFVGIIIEAKYMDAQLQVASPTGVEFARARAPVPAFGGIGRVNIGRHVSVTGEATYFKLPESIDQRYRAHLLDVDIYGTFNFTRNFGVQGGFRRLELGYQVEKDQGQGLLLGPYFGGVVRY